MNRFSRILVRPLLVGIALVALGVRLPMLRAQPRDVAELFPGDAILYVEVVRPEAVAKDLAAFFKGSILENPHSFFNQNGPKGKEGELLDRSDPGILASLLGSAMLREAKQFQGIAFAVTGYRPNGDAEYIAVLKPGESKLPHSFLRNFLLKNAGVKKAETVEGIEVFQDNGLTGIPAQVLPCGQGIEAPPPVPRFALAQTSGLVIVGSNKDQIATVIRRWKEKEKSASLAASAAFPEIVAGRKQPGLFVWANAKDLTNWIEPFLRASRPSSPTTWVAIKELLPSTLVRSLTAHVSLSADSIRCSLGLTLVSNNSVPLLDFLNGPPLAVEQLHSLPSDGAMILTMSFPKAERRLKKVLPVFDTLIQASGTLGPTAGELLQELIDQKRQPDPRKTFSQVSGLSLLLPALEIGKSGIPIPTMVLHTDDAETAQAVETLVPAILEVLNGEGAQPIVETIDGQKIRSLAVSGTTLHYGRKDTRFAVGPDRKRLAAVLIAGKAKSETVAPGATAPAGNVLAIGLRWDELLKAPPKGRSGSTRPRRFPPQAIEDLRSDPPFRESAATSEQVRSLLEQVRSLPPLWIGLRQRDRTLRLDWEQAAPNSGFAKLIDGWFQAYVRASELRRAYEPGLLDTP